MALTAWISWNPDPVAFYVPFTDFPIFLYGVCFVSGFIIGYFLLIRLMSERLQNKALAQKIVDHLTWFVVLGTIIGARLGHVLFYDWERYKHNLLLIFNTREGGLASHGGTIGVLLAISIYYFFFFRKQTKLSLLALLDMVVVPTALVGFFIRLGNFFNQEILGNQTTLPWGIIFGHPADGGPLVPRHPAMLYEAFAYLMIFFLLLYLWYRTSVKLWQGFLTGLFFLLVFGSRFLLEFVKTPFESTIDQTVLQAGQWLSVPFIIGGIALLCWSIKTHDKTSTI